MQNRVKRRQNTNLVLVNDSHLNGLYDPLCWARVHVFCKSCIVVGGEKSFQTVTSFKIKSFNRPEINTKRKQTSEH